MSDDSPKALVGRLFELYNDEGLPRIPDLFVDDGAWNYAATAQGPAERVAGKAAMQARINGMLSAFKDIRIDVHSSITEGNVVASRWTWRGTCRLPAGPIPAGARLRMSGSTFHIVRNDVLVESFDTWAAPEIETHST